MSAASSFRTLTLRQRHRRALAARTRWSWHPALRVGTVAGFLALCFSTSAFAADVKGLIIQKRCAACHDLTATRIGPPFVAIALRHRADKDNMIEVLARKI